MEGQFSHYKEDGNNSDKPAKFLQATLEKYPEAKNQQLDHLNVFHSRNTAPAMKRK